MKEENFLIFKKDIFTNSFLVSFRYVAIAAIGLVVSIAFAHLSTKQTFGQYQFILSVLTLFSVFSLPGLNIAALKSVSQGECGVVSQAVRLSFFGGILAIPLLVGYGVYVLLTGSSDSVIGWACVLFGFLFPFLNASNTWYVHYEGRLLFRPVVIRTVISSILTALALVFGLWIHAGLLALVSAWFFSTVLYSWFFYWEVLEEEHKYKEKPGTLDIRYGLRVSLQKFIVGLTENIPIIAISFFLGFEAAANFQVVSVFVGAVSGLLGALTAMALPVIFSDTDNNHKGLLLQSVFSGVLASVGYAVFVEIFFSIIYGNQYYESFQLAHLLVFLPLLVSLRLFFVNIFTAREENSLIVFSYILANIFSIVLFILVFKTAPFSWSAGVYLYSINLSLLVPLVGVYLFRVFKKPI